MDLTPDLLQYFPESTRSIVERVISEVQKLESLKDDPDLDRSWIQKRIVARQEFARVLVRSDLSTYRFVKMKCKWNAICVIYSVCSPYVPLKLDWLTHYLNLRDYKMRCYQGIDKLLTFVISGRPTKNQESEPDLTLPSSLSLWHRARPQEKTESLTTTLLTSATVKSLRRKMCLIDFI